SDGVGSHSKLCRRTPRWSVRLLRNDSLTVNQCPGLTPPCTSVCPCGNGWAPSKVYSVSGTGPVFAESSSRDTHPSQPAHSGNEQNNSQTSVRCAGPATRLPPACPQRTYQPITMLDSMARRAFSK